MVKRCLFCGQYFTPDRRVKDRQKSCGRPECWKARKKKAQEAWTERNPGYFQGRYPYVKAWRQGRKMIQDKIPPKNPYVELVIRMGPLRGRWFKVNFRRKGARGERRFLLHILIHRTSVLAFPTTISPSSIIREIPQNDNNYIQAFREKDGIHGYNRARNYRD